MADCSGPQVTHLQVEHGALAKATEATKDRAANHKLLLQTSRDSGYFSPVTPGTTPGTTPESAAPKSKTLHLDTQAHRSISGPPTTVSDSDQKASPHVSAKRGLKRALSSPGALDSVSETPSVQVSPCPLINHQSNRMMLEQQQINFTCDSSSILFLAFKCKELNQSAWQTCKHPYCVHVRNNLAHESTCFNGRSGSCKRCFQFHNELYRHAELCTDTMCPVEMCHSYKQLLHSVLGNMAYQPQGPGSLQGALQHPQLARRSSFSGLEQQYSMGDSSDMYYSLNHSTITEDTPTSLYIGARADEIVNKLDQEIPLIIPETPVNSNSNSLPPASLGRPGSLKTTGVATSSEGEATLYQPLSMLSPIVEGSEDFPSFPGGPQLWGGVQPLSLMSSCEADGVMGQGSKTMPSMSLNSLGGEDDNLTVYPEQRVLHKLREDYLTIGADGCYYQHRDYNAQEVTGAGGFGNVRPATDLSNEHLFAIKCNIKEDEAFIQSMETEARMLARLGPHVNVVHMFGAVVDVLESSFHPTRMYKLLMELAEHGNLSEMLINPETMTPSPLDQDQALYYFWQLLRGVNFLHENGVLHLDIKSSNVLVFDEGRTMKICDFGTAVHINEVASSVGKNLGTPQFAAPEICRQEMPRFSSDIWSAMCVLVEMLTTKAPWTSDKFTYQCTNQIIFRVGNYEDSQMESALIPNADTLEPDVKELMRLAFRACYQDRADSRTLLNHPLIVNAYQYEYYFDQALCDDEDEDVPYASHVSAPTSLPLAPCPEDPAPSGEVGYQQSNQKRFSEDSSLGMELEQDVQTPMSGSFGGSGRKISVGMNSDSGLDTPFTTTKCKFYFSTEESPSELTDSDNTRSLHLLQTPFTPEGTYHSLPNPAPHSDPIKVQRSCSLTLNARSPSSSIPSPSHFGSGHRSWTQWERQHHSYDPNSRLRHSNSAPVIGGQLGRRRLSLQLSGHAYEEGEWSGSMRRTSSEVYVDRGPDIDSPEKIRIWAKDVLSKDHTPSTLHPHKHAASPAQPRPLDDRFATGHAHSRLRNLAPSSDEATKRLPALPSQQSDEENEESQCTGILVTSPDQEVKGHNKGVKTKGAGLQKEGGTQVEQHVTSQGKKFETYKTVC